MRCDFLDRIADIDARSWDGIAGEDYPFTRHAFLLALESSGSVSRDTGWQPQHLLVYDGDYLLAVMPLYRKYHSYGEYIFDWAWAEAYQRHGLSYYPKLLAAIPFTPANGPRLCLREGADSAAVLETAVSALRTHARATGCSSLHVLLPDEGECKRWSATTLLQRHSVQYHWFNNGYRSFDDFLASFSSRKRKSVRRERQRMLEQGLQLVVLEGPQLTAEHWQAFVACYQDTYLKRSGHAGYLNAAFFAAVAENLSAQIVMVLAYCEGVCVAAALNYRDSRSLYGRHWGCLRDFDQLHFEACYYQGIEYCIANGLQHFDAGAQGEHKIQRGFTPVPLHSYHWLADARFHAAIADYVSREALAVDEHIAQARTLLPFKLGLNP